MLVKFCKPQHNLALGCNTLRLGTLEYYRQMDPKFSISDSDEGTDSHMVHHCGPGQFSKEYNDFLGSVPLITPEMYIGGITFKRTFPNAYIWCCKTYDSDQDIGNGSIFDESYTSNYKISDANLFAELIARLISERVKREHFSDWGLKIIDSIPIAQLRVGISYYHAPVVYVEKKHGELVAGRYFGYDEKVPMPLRPYFVKNIKYKNDSEYRFVFFFHNNERGYALSVKPDPLDLAIPAKEGMFTE